MDNFVDSNSKSKLEILELLVRKRVPMSIEELADEIKASNKTVRKLVNELETELSEDEKFGIHYSGSKIKSIYASNLSILDIGMRYLKNSIYYKIMIDLFYDRLDRKIFCEREFISESLFKLKIKQLKEKMSNYSLSLDSKLKIVGEEFKIRNFFYIFFSSTVSEWPFDESFKNKLDQNFKGLYALWENLNMINQSRFCLVLYISYIRNSNMRYLENNRLGFLENEFNQVELKICIRNFFKETNVMKDLENEVRVACLFIFKEHLVPFKISDGQISRSELKNELSYIKFSDVLTQKIIDFFFPVLPYEDFKRDINKCTDLFHMELVYGMIDARDFFYTFNKDGFYYKDDSEELLYEQVQILYQHLMKDGEYQLWYEQVESTVKKEVYLDQLYIMIYNIKNKVTPTTFDKVRIYVQNSKKHVEELIIYKIKLIFSEKVEILSTPYQSKIDLLVTDTITKYNELLDEQIVILPTFSNKYEFEILINKIMKTVFEKYTERKI